MADYPVSGQTNPLGKPRLMDLQGESDTIRFPVMLGKQGGLGFQFEGGIITVVANSAGVDVNFDRPMVYNGDFTPPSPNNPFQIGQPSLNASALTLDIPVVVGAGFDFSHMISGVRLIAINFTAPVRVTQAGLAPGLWSVTTVNPAGVAVSIYGVVANGSGIYLVTSEHTTGVEYTVTMPPGVISSQSGLPYTGVLSANYIGLGDVPRVDSAQIQDIHTIVLTFNEEVKEAEASNTANYSVSPTLTVTKVVKVNSTTYRMTVSNDIEPLLYTVTISGISDLANNYI